MMKIFLLLALTAFSSLVAAPSLAELKEPLTVKTYQVQKVYAHQLGYRVDLINDYGRLVKSYVKSSWLYDRQVRRDELRGDVILQDRIPSYMMIYYRQGQPTRFTLYVQQPSHRRKMLIVATEQDVSATDFEISTLEVANTVATEQQ